MPTDADADTPPRMGRPPLGEKAEHTVMTPVRFPAATLARIEAAAGKGKRAHFIRQAVENELSRRESQAPE